MKCCTRCGEDKSRADFPKHRRAKDGLHSWCKLCHAASMREWRQRNLEQARERERKRYQRGGAERRRTLRQQRPGAEARTNRAWKWRQRYGSDPDVLGYLEALFEDPCAYCGSRKDIGLDHLEPQVDGGADHWTNLTACCRRCNGRKHANSLLIALAERVGYYRWQSGWAA